VLDQTNITSGLVNLNYQLNDKNRLTGLYSRQYYKKPNRFLAGTATLVKESTSNEDDVFDLYQLLWNSVLTQRMFIDARLGMNRIFFPTYLNGNDQTLNDTATGIRTRNFTTGTERWRDRVQANATGQYYLDQALGGRHEIKFGFDHAHAIVENHTRRFDDVDLNYNSATGATSTVIMYGTPFYDRSGVDVTSLYAQDAYAVKRLTMTVGVRWERLEAYLPEQSSPPSRFFPDIPRNFAEQRDIVNWHTIGPRFNAAIDLRGDGRTALKTAVGRYYYVISAGGGVLGAVNPNANYSQQFTWNDINGDKHFQLGEQTGTPVISQANLSVISWDPDYLRPYTDEFTGGLDHELIPGMRVSATYTYRQERNPQATSNPARPFETTLTTRADTGPDGVAGTADDTTFQFYNRTSATNLTYLTNDRNFKQTYNGVELVASKRMSNRWQMLAGYTYGRAKVSVVSVNVNPNALINATGPVNGQIGDRPQQFKLTGTYQLPAYDIGVAGNLNVQSGAAITRQVSTALTVGGTTTVNVEPLGAHRLPVRKAMDLRAFKTLRFGTKSLEVAVDFNNLTNSNTVWDARTLSGTLGFRQNGDPNGTLNTFPQFLSPSQVYPPRNIRFNAAYRF
jgi:hypothetical protein